MRAIIIDDDKLAIESLSYLIKKFDELELVGMFESAVTAISYLKSNPVDVIFLDVEMPDMSGLDFLEVASNLPQVILITNKTEYALDAFEYNVFDYLTKPVNLKRLTKSIDRLSLQKAEKIEKQQDKKSIFIKSDGRYVRVDLDQLCFIQAMDDYILFQLEDGNKFLVNSTMKAIEQELPPATFMRVHRSFIINLEKIVDFEDSSLVIAKKVVPVSKSYRNALFQRMGVK